MKNRSTEEQIIGVLKEADTQCLNSADDRQDSLLEWLAMAQS